MFSSSRTISSLHITTLSVSLSISNSLSYTHTHTHTHTRSLLPVSTFLTDCSELECETQLFKEHTSVRCLQISQTLSQPRGRMNTHHHMLKPSLPPSTYEIKSQLLNPEFEVTPASLRTAPLGSPTPGCTSEAPAGLFKKWKWPGPPHHWQSGRASVFWNFYKWCWSTASVGDHLFRLRFSKLAPLFLTSMPVHELLIHSVQNSISPWKCWLLKAQVKYSKLQKAGWATSAFPSRVKHSFYRLFPSLQALKSITLINHYSRQRLLWSFKFLEGRAVSCSSLYPPTYTLHIFPRSKHSTNVGRIEMLFKSIAEGFQPCSAWRVSIPSEPGTVLVHSPWHSGTH